MKILLLIGLILFTGIGVATAEPVTSTSATPSKKSHFVDEQIMIMADISNNQDVIQDFAYLTQVTNDEGVVISLSWLTGSLSPRQSFSPAQSWTPTESGIYPHRRSLFGKALTILKHYLPPLSMTLDVSEDFLKNKFCFIIRQTHHLSVIA